MTALCVELAMAVGGDRLRLCRQRMPRAEAVFLSTYGRQLLPKGRVSGGRHFREGVQLAALVRLASRGCLVLVVSLLGMALALALVAHP
jgi:hypothetical protein